MTECDSFLDDDDEPCDQTASGEHECVLSGEHLDAHLCDCGASW